VSIAHSSESTSSDAIPKGDLRHALIRVITFRARHHYGRAEWSPERNRQVFGGQVEPHEHRYRVEITVAGPLDPETGFVTDLGALDRWIETRILEPLGDSDLNQAIPEVADGRMQPSTEALAGWVLRRLEGGVQRPARIDRVRVWESDALAGEARPG
jgi:6-pyruvoyltetrahydropterin/6-carboxytetrahydropterin synthase